LKVGSLQPSYLENIVLRLFNNIISLLTNWQHKFVGDEGVQFHTR
jgi:hypothetical protein